jgi:hypothetical protein
MLVGALIFDDRGAGAGGIKVVHFGHDFHAA